MQNISLHGFNNLTKNLSFSLYKLHYLPTEQSHGEYKAYINATYCADNLTALLVKISDAIGGNVLNIAKQNYSPQGASATLMISEEAEPSSSAEVLVAHLDKSHLCIHTYPEENPQDSIAIFRADIELSTCGVISPLKVLNFVINAFAADVIDIDYRIRGMTRDKEGKKNFIIDKIDKISDELSNEITNSFNIDEYSFLPQNLFHARLAKKNLNISDYFLNEELRMFTDDKQESITQQLTNEIKQLFSHSLQ